MTCESPHHEPEWLSAGQPSLGRYILGPILGQGGAGEVREAWDVVLCRTVALKVLRRMEPVGLIRFMHEAQVQSRMVHPHICHVYDVDTSGGVPKISMQLVRGPTLAQEAGRLTVHEVVTILAQVAEAIHAAHRMQLIHRDIKPSNILLERGPEARWIPFVCDFGLAMALDEPSLTLGPGILGTPAFMAPEQVLGERRRVGPATDIYSLGVTLHFALFGEVPGAGPVRKGELPLPGPGVFPSWRNKESDLPADLATILRTCMETEPEHRYPSAQALAEDLWRFAQGTPIRARPVGRMEQAWRRFRPYRLPAIAVLVVACALVAGRLVELGRIDRDNRVRAETARMFELESADLEKELRLEKMLPIHDMRPTIGHIQERMAAIRRRMALLERTEQAPGHFALGRAHLVLRDFPAAKAELEQAWDLGIRGPDIAWMLARALVGAKGQEDRAALFETGQPALDSARVAGRIEDLLRMGQVAESDLSGYARALLAYVKGDFPHAASEAHASFRAHPWRYESAAIEAFSLTALGQARYDAGDLEAAARHWQAAMAAARQFLDVGQSDDLTQHVYFGAAARLANLRVRQGRMALAEVDNLQKQCAQALALDPGQPQLQDAWLQFSIISARRRIDQGLDARPGLRSALAYLAAQGRAPLAVELRAARMQLHWLLAQAEQAAGMDPWPELDRAIADLGHTHGLAIRDYYGAVLNFKARLEAARGQDPRSTLAAIQAEPAGAGQSWTRNLTGAEAWLAQAQWEADHGLDAQASLHRGRTLVDLALADNDQSTSGYALKDLARMLEGQLARATGSEQERGEPARAEGVNPSGRHPSSRQRVLADATSDRLEAKFQANGFAPF